MSYCRFSTNNFKCDLYVYGDVQGGYTIHVARNRPLLPDAEQINPLTDFEGFLAQNDLTMQRLATAEREEIKLKYAGESWFSLERETAVARLIELKELGYVFPYEIIDEIAAETD